MHSRYKHTHTHTQRKISREESTGQKPLSKPKVATKDGGKSRKVSLPPANSARIAELEREVRSKS